MYPSRGDAADLADIAADVELNFDVGAAASCHHVASDALIVLDEAGDTLPVFGGKGAAEEAFLLLAAPFLDDVEGRGAKIEDGVKALERGGVRQGEMIVDCAAPFPALVLLRLEPVDRPVQFRGGLRGCAQAPAIDQDELRPSFEHRTPNLWR